MMNVANRRGGFTLLELLVVIGIIGILAAIVIVAVNPGRQFAQARNAQRWNDVNALLNAIHQYAVDNNGVFPAGITSTVQEIAVGGADICADLVDDGDYITALPADPSNGSYTSCAAYEIDYTVALDASGNRVIIDAPSAEEAATISVRR